MPPRRAQPVIRVAVPRVSARQAASRTRAAAPSATVAAQSAAPVPALFLEDDECPVCTCSLSSMVCLAYFKYDSNNSKDLAVCQQHSTTILIMNHCA